MQNREIWDLESGDRRCLSSYICQVAVPKEEFMGVLTT